MEGDVVPMPQVTFSKFKDTRKVVIGDFDFLKVGDDPIFLDTFGDDRLTTTGAPCDKDLSGSSI